MRQGKHNTNTTHTQTQTLPVHQQRQHSSSLTHHTTAIGPRKGSLELGASNVSQGLFLPSKSHHELLPSCSLSEFHGLSEKMMPECMGREGRERRQMLSKS